MANGTISETIASLQFLKDKISAKDRLLICGIRSDLKHPVTQYRSIRKNSDSVRCVFKKSKSVLG